MTTRREFIAGAAAAAGMVTLASANSASQKSAIDRNFDALMNGIGLNPEDTGGTITFSGTEPLFPSATPLATAFALPAMACGAGAAINWRQRGGAGQNMSINIEQAAHGVFPEMTANPSLNGGPYPGFYTDNPIEQSHAYDTRDGRHIYVASVYPHQIKAWLKFLDCERNSKSVRAAILKWEAQALEDAANAIGLTACVARTSQEWLAHPQGRLLAQTPLIEIRKLGDSPVETLGAGSRPLSGVRVLAATHAIAGPTVGRCLSQHGADVLQFNKPDDFEHEWVYLDANVGSRSTILDLNVDEQHAKAHALLRDADIFVDNYRGRSLGKFGFLPEDLAKERPGIIVVTIRCYGWDGPWALRGGFDMLGCAASGLTMLEAIDGKPQLPSTLLINDHVAGYLGAAGAMAAISRRAREGGSYHVSVSLTRAAMWYQGLGMMNKKAMLQAFGGKANRLPTPDMITRQTPFGEVRRLAPAVKLSATPAYWEDPILVHKGSSTAEWRRQ